LCISRQRVWGSPIPSLHDTQTGEAILSVESLDHIIPILEKKGVSHWWTGPVEEFLPTYLKDSGRRFTKGADTIDVWFDSGSSWTMLEALYGGSGSGPSIPNQVPAADVCFEGSDQHRGWFQSLLLTAVGTTNDGQKSAAPFKNLITHGFILDEDGRKMSKSLGNIISPTTIIDGGEVRISFRIPHTYTKMPPRRISKRILRTASMY
jgi:isoleucyl-tRNA synthetase